MSDTNLTIPNAITVARFAAVPVVVHAMVFGEWTLAFAAFALAGVSDAVDGYIARHFHQRSTLGIYMDPLADKALIVAASVTLAWLGLLPMWLVLLIAMRDIAIVGAVAVMNFGRKRLSVKPLAVSKWNTGFQLALVGWILAANAFEWPGAVLTNTLMGAVVLLTVVSAAGYGSLLLRHMQKNGGGARAIDNPDGLR